MSEYPFDPRDRHDMDLVEHFDRSAGAQLADRYVALDRDTLRHDLLTGWNQHEACLVVLDFVLHLHLQYGFDAADAAVIAKAILTG
jgi:hypothetical protein